MRVRRLTFAWSQKPTAHALAAEIVVTPNRPDGYEVPEGVGLATLIQVFPSQCSVRVRAALPYKCQPTAQASPIRADAA